MMIFNPPDGPAVPVRWNDEKEQVQLNHAIVFDFDGATRMVEFGVYIHQMKSILHERLYLVAVYGSPAMTKGNGMVGKIID